MYFFRAQFIPFGLVLLLVLGASSCKQEQESHGGKTVKFNCGDQIVDVDANTGTKQDSVYVCVDDTVTWIAHDHNFKVEFKQGSPFSNDEKVFHNAHPKSGGAKHLKVLTVFPYKITVDGKALDPQVIGGGGN